MLQAGYNTRVIGCDFNSQVQYGISTNVTGTNSLLVSNSVISGAGTAGINLAVGGNNIVIRDNDLEANAVTPALTSYTSVLFEGNYAENNMGLFFSFSGTNNAIDIGGQNWLGTNSTTTTINTVTSGSFVNNTLYNNAFTFGSSTHDMDVGGNILTGTATLGTTPFTAVSSFSNNWTGSNVGYKKLTNGVAESRGDMAAGSGSIRSVAFTLPAGYRRSQNIVIPSINTASNAICAVYISTAGTVAPACAGGSSGNLIAIYGVMFTSSY
ncbi:hypothetical protein PQQ84_18835 [Paraburkholderia strydomiana]|uniref:hypothetical protein n=1 Tax=Paraburkholderia strydomiana TaxID=1245417 RepID=UPI0038B80478